MIPPGLAALVVENERLRKYAICGDCGKDLSDNTTRLEDPKRACGVCHRLRMDERELALQERTWAQERRDALAAQVAAALRVVEAAEYLIANRAPEHSAPYCRPGAPPPFRRDPTCSRCRLDIGLEGWRAALAAKAPQAIVERFVK